ncbi:hypothetical protein OSTOST_15905 [Ostertagia ostertagi]
MFELGSFTGGDWPRKGGRSLLGYAIPPPNVHSTDWRDMLSITEARDSAQEQGENSPNLRKTSEPHGECPAPVPPLFSQMRFSESDLSLNRAHWITETFNRRECARFVPTNKYPEKWVAFIIFHFLLFHLVLTLMIVAVLSLLKMEFTYNFALQLL